MMVLYNTHGWIHLSIGRADRWLRWGIVEWIVTCLLFVAGLPWGPQGIAVAWCTSFWILIVPGMWYAGKPIDLGLAPMFAAVWRYVAGSLLAGLASSAICSKLTLLSDSSGAGGAALRVVFVSVSFACLYLIAIVLLHGGLSPLQKIVSLLREMVSAVGGQQTLAIDVVEA
jgi:PST family polysaccharide transporter